MAVSHPLFFTDSSLRQFFKEIEEQDFLEE
jgi:hypothetical protein